MDVDRLLKCASKYLKIALGEDLPEDSKDLTKVLKNLENLDTFCARKRYAERNLKRLSSGSSRLVYLTSKGTILKLAKNEKGLAQNKAESNPKMKSKYLNKILRYAKNNVWIETEKLEKIKAKQFEEMTGVDFQLFSDAISYGLKDVAGTTHEKPVDFDEVKGSDVYKEMLSLGKKFKLMPGDMARISSWLTDGKRVILADCGLTREVYDIYYDD